MSLTISISAVSRWGGTFDIDGKLIQLEEEELDEVINSEYNDLTSAIQAYKSNAIDGNKTQLKGLITDEIIKRFFYSEGLYTYYTQHNKEIKKALSILNNPSQYASILR